MRAPSEVVVYAAVAIIVAGCDSSSEDSAKVGAKTGQMGPQADAASTSDPASGLDAAVASDVRDASDASTRDSGEQRSQPSEPTEAGPAIDVGDLPDAAAADSSVGTGECWDAVLPLIVLHTLGGEQIGVQGSFCSQAAGANCSSCVDIGIEPDHFTVVHPGDELTFSMDNGTLVAGPRCTPECPPTLRFESASCEPRDELAVALHEDLPWTVDLDPGTYFVWVDSHFEADNGDTGQTYTGFGLIVSDSAERSVVGSTGVDAGCRR